MYMDVILKEYATFKKAHKKRCYLQAGMISEKALSTVIKEGSNRSMRKNTKTVLQMYQKDICVLGILREQLKIRAEDSKPGIEVLILCLEHVTELVFETY